MSYIHPAAAEHLRRRWLKPDWQRWMREDAHRFAPPGVKAESARSDRADDAGFAAELNRLRAQQGELRRMLAGVQFELALRALGRKYSHDQPRVPAGNSDGIDPDYYCRVAPVWWRRILGSPSRTLVKM